MFRSTDPKDRTVFGGIRIMVVLRSSWHSWIVKHAHWGYSKNEKTAHVLFR